VQQLVALLTPSARGIVAVRAARNDIEAWITPNTWIPLLELESAGLSKLKGNYTGGNDDLLDGTIPWCCIGTLHDGRQKDSLQYNPK